MSDRLSIDIDARNSASPVFIAIGRDAKTMGDIMRQVGQQGTQSFRQVGEAAEQAGGKFDRAKAQATVLGTAIGTVGSAAALLGQSFRDQERLASGIERAYGDAAGQLLDFSEHMQDTTRFSNDAAQSALLLANSLSNNYGLAAADIEALTMRAADMAQMFGVSLPDAMSRLAGAIRGEGEAAELLGLNMSDAAVAAEALRRGIEGWNVPGALSEAEKAAFRYTLLMEQSAFATGAAAEAAEGAGGAFRRIVNELQDAGQAAGGFLGPVGQIAAEFAPIALALPIVSGGIGKISDEMRKAGAQHGILSALASPITAIGLAAGVAGFALLGMNERISDAVAASKSLDEVLNELRMEGLEDTADQLQEIRDEINGVIDDLEGAGWTDLVPFNLGDTPPIPADMKAQISGMLEDAFTDARVDVEAFVQWVNDELSRIGTLSGEEKTEAQIQFLRDLGDPSILNEFRLMVGSTTTSVVQDTATMAAAFADVETAANSLGSKQFDLMFQGLDDAARNVGQLDEVFDLAVRGTREYIDESGRIVPATQLSAGGLEILTGAFGKLEEQMASGKYDTDKIMADMMAIATNPELSPDQRSMEYLNLSREIETTDSYLAALNLTAEEAAAQQEKLAWGLEATASAADLQAAKMDWAKQALQDYITNGQNFFQVMDIFSDKVDLSAARSTVWADSIDTVNKRVVESVKYWDDAGNQLAGIDAAFNLAEDLAYAAEMLDSMLGTFDRIDALGQRSSKAGAIADYMFGPDGDPRDGLGPLAELLENDRISLEQFNETREAGIRIQESDARVQEHLNKIRADQLPLLAEQQEAYETYIAGLSEMSAEEQQYALALADSGYQMQISNLYAQAYAASMGQIPEEVATELIANAAQADPVLAGILEDMGLIEIGANGEITVNFPNGEDVTTTLADVNQSLADLIDLLDNGALDNSYTISVKAKLDLSEIPGGPGGIGPMGPGGGWGGEGLAPEPIVIETKYYATYDVDDQATPKLESIDAMLRGMDGARGTMFVEGENADAITTFEEATQRHSALDGELSVMEVGGDASDAFGEFTSVASAHKALNGDTSTMFVEGDASDAYDAINSISNYDGVTLATSYYQVVTVYSSVGSRGGGQYVRDGGLVQRATGGLVPVEAGEVGMELVHLATGGTIPIREHGIHALPANAYVSPAHASASTVLEAGGNTYQFDFAGATFVGIEGLAEQLMPVFAEAIELAQEDNLRRNGRL